MNTKRASNSEDTEDLIASLEELTASENIWMYVHVYACQDFHK